MSETELRRLAEHLAYQACGGQCTLTAFIGEGDDTEGRCPGQVVAVRWEHGFADEVCERHAATALGRGALVVRLRRHDGTPAASRAATGEGGEGA
jgi:hypothetical protein